MSALTITHLSKAFGTVEALKDISLDIASGEFICLLGGSGCGKTTLLRLIAGLVAHDRGQILLDGKDLTAVPSHQRNIGMVFQSLALFPHLNVGDNIAYGMRLRRVAGSKIDAEVARLLDMVGLSGLTDRPITALSGGQRQRVAIARALALQPDIFLMDEPFSALDAALRDQMQIEVKRIQRSLGVTTVFVTHDQREAMALADRIVIMNGGVVEQAGAPDDLYARPQSRFVAEFIGSNNIFDGTVQDTRFTINGADIGPASGPLDGLTGAQSIAVRPEAIVLRPAGADGLSGRITLQRRLGAVLEREILVGNAGMLTPLGSCPNDSARHGNHRHRGRGLCSAGPVLCGPAAVHDRGQLLQSRSDGLL